MSRASDPLPTVAPCKGLPWSVCHRVCSGIRPQFKGLLLAGAGEQHCLSPAVCSDSVSATPAQSPLFLAAGLWGDGALPLACALLLRDFGAAHVPERLPGARTQTMLQHMVPALQDRPACLQQSWWHVFQSSPASGLHCPLPHSSCGTCGGSIEGRRLGHRATMVSCVKGDDGAGAQGEHCVMHGIGWCRDTGQPISSASQGRCTHRTAVVSCMEGRQCQVWALGCVVKCMTTNCHMPASAVQGSPHPARMTMPQVDVDRCVHCVRHLVISGKDRCWHRMFAVLRGGSTYRWGWQLNGGHWWGAGHIWRGTGHIW